MTSVQFAIILGSSLSHCPFPLQETETAHFSIGIIVMALQIANVSCSCCRGPYMASVNNKDRRSFRSDHSTCGMPGYSGSGSEFMVISPLIQISGTKNQKLGLTIHCLQHSNFQYPEYPFKIATTATWTP